MLLTKNKFFEHMVLALLANKLANMKSFEPLAVFLLQEEISFMRKDFNYVKNFSNVKRF
jgi:hypothetical protein